MQTGDGEAEGEADDDTMLDGAMEVLETIVENSTALDDVDEDAERMTEEDDTMEELIAKEVADRLAEVDDITEVLKPKEVEEADDEVDETEIDLEDEADEGVLEALEDEAGLLEEMTPLHFPNPF